MMDTAAGTGEGAACAQAVIGAVHTFVDSPVYGCLKRGKCAGAVCAKGTKLEGASARNKQ
jgi:hypothetical protein